jgi:SAM-dependent methyltransferase
MSDVADHYQQLLAEHYTWMFGVSFEEKVKEQRELLERVLHDLPLASERGAAIDLGCGPGFQSVALAQLGFRPVVAIDFSRDLLDELRTHAGAHAIEIKQADLADLSTLALPDRVPLVLCMGDTLSHLPSRAEVKRLLHDVARRLAPEGSFIITYRDLSVALEGTDRFLPIRADETKIMTCVLEFRDQDSVVVNDLVYVRDEGGWQFRKSSYLKLRLPINWITGTLSEAGFKTISTSQAGRLQMIVATLGA